MAKLVCGVVYTFVTINTAGRNWPSAANLRAPCWIANTLSVTILISMFYTRLAVAVKRTMASMTVRVTLTCKFITSWSSPIFLAHTSPGVIVCIAHTFNAVCVRWTYTAETSWITGTGPLRTVVLLPARHTNAISFAIAVAVRGAIKTVFLEWPCACNSCGVAVVFHKL